MINTIIALLITLATGGDICETGQAIDWYAYVDQHPDYTPDVIVFYGGKNQFFITTDDVLFVFRDAAIDDHGRCSRQLDTP